MRRSAVVVALSLSLATSACGSGDRPGGAGACALVVRYDGRTYDGYSLVNRVPRPGASLGVAILPPCIDNPGAVGEQPEEIEVARFPGLPPGQALLWVGNEGTAFVRSGLELPAEVRTLLQPVACPAGVGEIGLRGDWLGILAPGHETETDLRPPYDVDVFVVAAQPADLERSYVTVRVRRSLDSPISRYDVRRALLRPGQLDIRAECDGDRFVATYLNVLQ